MAQSPEHFEDEDAETNPRLVRSSSNVIQNATNILFNIMYIQL